MSRSVCGFVGVCVCTQRLGSSVSVSTGSTGSSFLCIRWAVSPTQPFLTLYANDTALALSCCMEEVEGEEEEEEDGWRGILRIHREQYTFSQTTPSSLSLL